MNDEIDHQELVLRAATPADEIGIRELNTAAFGQDNEARLVSRLRHCGALVLEMVAQTPRGRILGHIAFSRVTPADSGPGQGLLVTCLAPMAVWPEFQHQGIGGKLITRSLELLREKGEDLVVVLGYPTYYPRFGFDAELAQKVHGPYSGIAFMACALSEAGSRDLPVTVTFATPFEEFE
ncbi:N-acetyltransferase [Roseibium sp. CAU 1637]|uniref:N-acetyltransferase n=1 Tax=Roseibium limicola TaxID=2816037 RepID=A0A939ENN0_9HYPH|nr:N-acetyltransferase [Roseibium limicola]MBO0345703.1 N-acetyltransferase [Roseibium limicola]